MGLKGLGVIKEPLVEKFESNLEYEKIGKVNIGDKKIPVFQTQVTKQILINKFEIAGENKQGFIADLQQSQKLIVGEKEFNIEIGERKQATKITTQKDIYLQGVKFKGELSYQIDSEFNIKVGEKLQYGRIKGIQEIGDKTFKGIEAVRLGNKDMLTAYIGKTSKEGKITDIISSTGKELSITKDIELLNAKVGEAELKVSAEKGINIKNLEKFKQEFFEETKSSKSRLYDETIGSLKTQQVLKNVLGKSTTSSAIKSEILKTITEEVNKTPELFTKTEKAPIKLTKFNVFAGDVVFKGATVFPKTVKFEDLVVSPDFNVRGGYKFKAREEQKESDKLLAGVGLSEDLMPKINISSMVKGLYEEKEEATIFSLSLPTDLKQSNIPKFKFLPKSIQTQKQQQDIDLILEQLTKPKIEKKTTKKTITEQKPNFFIPVDNGELIKLFKSLKLGYEVFEKKKRMKLGKGKYKDIGYVKISKTPLTEAGAKVLLMEELKKTARRSGFIKPIQSENIQNYKDYELDSLSYQFEAGKRNKNLIVQKAKFSIGTPGEKREISYKRKNSGLKLF
jgi:hypothetical protein